MARIRTIKPEFWTDSKTGKLSDRAKLIFLGILNLCDDYGVLEYDPEEWKVRILPYCSDTTTGAVIPFFLNEIVPIGLVNTFVLRDGDGSINEYVLVKSFNKHQVVNKPSRPLIEGWKKGDTIETYTKRMGISVDTKTSVPDDTLPEGSDTTTGVLPFRKEGKGRERKGEDKTTTATKTETSPPACAHEASTDAAVAEEILEEEKIQTKTENPAVEIIKAFDLYRVKSFGENQARPWPNQADLSVAKYWLESGIPISTIIDVFDYGMGRKSSEGAEPPASLKYFDRAVREQHKRDGQPGAASSNDDQAQAVPHPDADLNLWKNRLNGFKSQGFWLDAWGPKPTAKGHQIPIKAHPELADFIEKLKDKPAKKQPKIDDLTLPEKIVDRFVRLGVKHWPDGTKSNGSSQLERQAQQLMKRAGPELDDRIVDLMGGVFDNEFGALVKLGEQDRPDSMTGLTNAIVDAIRAAKEVGSEGGSNE